MGSSQLQFSVVIPVYNRPQLLFKVLDSLERQTLNKSKFEVIVVDDGSTDKEVSLVLRGKLSKSLNLRVLKQTNQGPARAREFGARKAYADWIAYIDSDCYAAPDWLQGFAEQLNELSIDLGKVGAIEGLTKAGLPPDANEVVSENAINRGAFTHETENLTGGKYPTCNMLVRKELCHFFPSYERLHYFREDTDLAFSVLESGYEIPFNDRAKVYHPSLPAKWNTPIRLALRYIYDPLLKRRFPKRYQSVDSHRIAGIQINHLRKKIYALFCLASVTLLVAVTTGIAIIGIPLAWPGVAGTALGWTGVVYLHSRGSRLNAGLPKELLLIAGLSFVVPWILFYSLLRGKIRFSQIRPFNREAFLQGYK